MNLLIYPDNLHFPGECKLGILFVPLHIPAKSEFKLVRQKESTKVHQQCRSSHHVSVLHLHEFAVSQLQEFRQCFVICFYWETEWVGVCVSVWWPHGWPSRSVWEGRDFLKAFWLSKTWGMTKLCGSVLAMIQGFHGTGSYIKAFFIPGWAWVGMNEENCSSARVDKVLTKSMSILHKAPKNQCHGVNQAVKYARIRNT